LAKSIPNNTKAGVGDAKREEICRLILTGLAHAEVYNAAASQAAR
jgi:hypothetical protein